MNSKYPFSDIVITCVLLMSDFLVYALGSWDLCFLKDHISVWELTFTKYQVG